MIGSGLKSIGYAGLAALCLFFCAMLAAQPNVPSRWRHVMELATFHIVLPEDASPLLKQAGEVFQRLWKQSTNRAISLGTTNEGHTNVWLGTRQIADDLIADTELARLHSEEFIARTYTPSRRDMERGAKKQLFIAGGSDLAVLQGVYAFFTQEMGVTFLEPGLIYTPGPPRGVNAFELRHRPEFSLREIGLLMKWKKGVEEYRYAHTLTPEKLSSPGAPNYFDRFSGDLKETTEHSNAVSYGTEAGAKKIFDEICAVRSAAMAPDQDAGSPPARCTFVWRTPGATWWLLSAMTHLTPVLSEEGIALNAEQDSPSAAIIQTANIVAQFLEEEFPEETHLVHVLLSPATQQPPAQLKPHSKVVVQLSTAACNFATPLSDKSCPLNLCFSEALVGWRRLGAHIHVYDHLINQKDPLLPFPSLESLQANILFYTQREVEGVYFAGLARGYTGEIDLAALRVFCAARLLFNPDVSEEELRQQFLEGFYGPAAPTIAQYIQLLQKDLHASQLPLTIHDSCDWLTGETLEQISQEMQPVLSQELPDPVRKRVEAVIASVAQVKKMRDDKQSETSGSVEQEHHDQPH